MRSGRLIRLSERLREIAGDRYPLGAIAVAGASWTLAYWPGFPWGDLARTYDAVLPMTYSRTGFTDPPRRGPT